MLPHPLRLLRHGGSSRGPYRLLLLAQPQEILHVAQGCFQAADFLLTLSAALRPGPAASSAKRRNASGEEETFRCMLFVAA